MMDTRQQLQPAHMMMHSNSNRTSTSTNKQFSQLYAAASGLLPTGGNTAWAPSTPQAPAAAWPHAPATPPPSQFPILEKFLSKQPQAQELLLPTPTNVNNINMPADAVLSFVAVQSWLQQHLQLDLQLLPGSFVLVPSAALNYAQHAASIPWRLRQVSAVESGPLAGRDPAAATVVLVGGDRVAAGSIGGPLTSVPDYQYLCCELAALQETHALPPLKVYDVAHVAFRMRLVKQLRGAIDEHNKEQAELRAAGYDAEVLQQAAYNRLEGMRGAPKRLPPLDWVSTQILTFVDLNPCAPPESPDQLLSAGQYNQLLQDAAAAWEQYVQCMAAGQQPPPVLDLVPCWAGLGGGNDAEPAVQDGGMAPAPAAQQHPAAGSTRPQQQSAWAASAQPALHHPGFVGAGFAITGVPAAAMPIQTPPPGPGHTAAQHISSFSHYSQYSHSNPSAGLQQQQQDRHAKQQLMRMPHTQVPPPPPPPAAASLPPQQPALQPSTAGPHYVDDDGFFQVQEQPQQHQQDSLAPQQLLRPHPQQPQQPPQQDAAFNMTDAEVLEDDFGFFDDPYAAPPAEDAGVRLPYQQQPAAIDGQRGHADFQQQQTGADYSYWVQRGDAAAATADPRRANALRNHAQATQQAAAAAPPSRDAADSPHAGKSRDYAAPFARQPDSFGGRLARSRSRSRSPHTSLRRHRSSSRQPRSSSRRSASPAGRRHHRRSVSPVCHNSSRRSFGSPLRSPVDDSRCRPGPSSARGRNASRGRSLSPRDRIATRRGNSRSRSRSRSPASPASIEYAVQKWLKQLAAECGPECRIRRGFVTRKLPLPPCIMRAYNSVSSFVQRRPELYWGSQQGHYNEWQLCLDPAVYDALVGRRAAAPAQHQDQQPQHVKQPGRDSRERSKEEGRSTDMRIPISSGIPAVPQQQQLLVQQQQQPGEVEYKGSVQQQVEQWLRQLALILGPPPLRGAPPRQIGIKTLRPLLPMPPDVQATYYTMNNFVENTAALGKVGGVWVPNTDWEVFLWPEHHARLFADAAAELAARADAARAAAEAARAAAEAARPAVPKQQLHNVKLKASVQQQVDKWLQQLALLLGPVPGPDEPPKSIAVTALRSVLPLPPDVQRRFSSMGHFVDHMPSLGKPGGIWAPNTVWEIFMRQEDHARLLADAGGSSGADAGPPAQAAGVSKAAAGADVGAAAAGASKAEASAGVSGAAAGAAAGASKVEASAGVSGAASPAKPATAEAAAAPTKPAGSRRKRERAQAVDGRGLHVDEDRWELVDGHSNDHRDDKDNNSSSSGGGGSSGKSSRRKSAACAASKASADRSTQQRKTTTGTITTSGSKPAPPHHNHNNSKGTSRRSSKKGREPAATTVAAAPDATQPEGVGKCSSNSSKQPVAAAAMTSPAGNAGAPSSGTNTAAAAAASGDGGGGTASSAGVGGGDGGKGRGSKGAEAAAAGAAGARSRWEDLEEGGADQGASDGPDRGDAAAIAVSSSTQLQQRNEQQGRLLPATTAKKHKQQHGVQSPVVARCALTSSATLLVRGRSGGSPTAAPSGDPGGDPGAALKVAADVMQQLLAVYDDSSSEDMSE